MDAHTYLTRKQLAWARRNHVEHDASGFVARLEDNLFQPLSDGALGEYKQGAGGELNGNMRALHSSSALIVNLFDFWRRQDSAAAIFRACGLEVRGSGATIEFERVFPVAGVKGTPPHLDVVVSAPRGRVIAFESKFREPYPGGHKEKVQAQYFNDPGRWAHLGELHKLAQRVSAGEAPFTHLHVSQFIKHILGLTSAYPDRAKGTFVGFTFIYAWHDTPFDEGSAHRREIGKFAEMAAADGVDFRAITHQEILLNLASEAGASHRAYLDYITGRYL